VSNGPVDLGRVGPNKDAIFSRNEKIGNMRRIETGMANLPLFFNPFTDRFIYVASLGFFFWYNDLVFC
jgi:hypothetical protein